MTESRFDTLRNRLGWWLHGVADQVGKKSAYRCYPAVIDPRTLKPVWTGDLPHSDDDRGVPLYYRDDEDRP